MLSGVGITLSSLDPKALFWRAIINRVVVLVPLMAMMMVMARTEKLWRGALCTVGWITTIVMAIATVAMIGYLF
jgi:hypothetical protein